MRYPCGVRYYPVSSVVVGREGLNRRRVVAAIFFSVVIIAVLGVIVGAEIVSGGQTESVLRLRTSVQRGAVFSAGDVDVVPLRVAPGDLNYEAPGAVPPGSRYAVSLQAGDVLIGVTCAVAAGFHVSMRRAVTQSRIAQRQAGRDELPGTSLN